MNHRIEQLLYESGLTAQGCWDELDSYAREHIERLVLLTIAMCSDVADDWYVNASDIHWNPGQHIRNYFSIDN